MSDDKNETCVCLGWAREDWTASKHHEKCPKGWSPDALRLIGDLVKGMEAWAKDEDGVHADAWGAYVTARTVIGRPLTADEYDKATR